LFLSYPPTDGGGSGVRGWYMKVFTDVIHRFFFVDMWFSFDVRLDRGVIICLGDQETKVLVRSRWWLEDGGGLPTHRVIYTHHQDSVVTMGT
jgi:hypothetical protein